MHSENLCLKTMGPVKNTSDLSQVFQVGDIFTLLEQITASERHDLGEKYGYSSWVDISSNKFQSMGIVADRHLVAKWKEDKK